MTWSSADSARLRRQIEKWSEDKDRHHERQSTLLARLRGGNEREQRVAKVISKCTPYDPCDRGFCLDCRFEVRHSVVPQVGVLLMEEIVAFPGSKLCLISTVDHRDGRVRGALEGFDFKGMLFSFCTQAKRIGLSFGFVGVDISFNRWRFDVPPPLWQPHVHGAFVTTLSEDEIRAGFKRSFPKGPGVNNPIDVEFVENLDELPAVVTYCFKLETTERNPYLQHYWQRGKWRRRRPAPRAWQGREHALAQNVPVSDLIMLIGMKRWWEEGAVFVERL